MDWHYTTAEEVMEELAGLSRLMRACTYARLMQTAGAMAASRLRKTLYLAGTALPTIAAAGCAIPPGGVPRRWKRFAVAWPTACAADCAR